MGEETSVLELKAKSSNSDSQIILASPRGSPVRSGSPRKALRTVFCDDSSDAYQPQFKHPSMEGWKSWQAHPTCVKRFNIDQSHNRLVTLSSQGPMRVWDASNFKLLAELISPNDCPLSNAMQYAENICMVGTQSGDLLEWDLSVIQNSDAEESPRLFPDRSIHRLAPKCKYEGHIGNVTGLQFDNSVLISGSADGTVRIWDRESRLPLSVLGQTVSQPLHPTSSGISTSGNTAVQSLYFYHHALASGYDNGVVRLWDTRTGYCHRKLSSSESCVRHLSFDKNYLVTGSADGLVEFWDLRQDAVVESVAFHQPILSLSLDRGRVVVGTTSQIGIFSLQEPLPTAYPVWALTDLSFSDGQLFFSDTSGQMHQRRIL